MSPNFREFGPPPQAGYFRFFTAMFHHALTTMLRRRGVILAAGLVLSPVVIPLALAFLSDSMFAEDGSRIFVRLVEDLYLDAMAPLLALFFGCMLVGEDVESQTMPYLLTRPLPRSAFVLGRFAAYMTVASVILVVSIAMAFAACTSLAKFQFGIDTLPLLVHYEGVAILALFAYGALAVLLGAALKHPIVIGILFIFGWQGLAFYIPGMVDFLTIDKYLTSLLPKLATERQNVVLQTALMEIEKQQLLIEAPKALLMLIALTVVFLVMTCMVVRRREYSAARTMGN